MRTTVELLFTGLSMLASSCSADSGSGQPRATTQAITESSSTSAPFDTPYADSSRNYIYNLLFCDNPAFFGHDTAVENRDPYKAVFD